MDRIKKTEIVALANEIARARFSLGETEQKIIMTTFSKVKPEDMELRTYSFQYHYLVEKFGMKPGGNTMKTIEEAIEKLMKRVMIIKSKGGRRRTRFHWVDRSEFDDETQTVTIKISKDIAHLVLGLKAKGYYNQFMLENILKLRGKHAPRIYQMLKASEYQGWCEFTVQEFKEMLELDKDKGYQSFSKLDLWVISPAIKQINVKTDLHVKYFKLKQRGKAIVGLKFVINKVGPRVPNKNLFSGIDQEILEESSVAYHEKSIIEITDKIERVKQFIDERKNLDLDASTTNKIAQKKKELSQLEDDLFEHQKALGELKLE